jgi:hypothetical protein
LLFLSSFSLFCLSVSTLFSYLCHQRWRTYSISAKKETSFFVLRSIFRNFAANYRLLHYY